MLSYFNLCIALIGLCYCILLFNFIINVIHLLVLFHSFNQECIILVKLPYLTLLFGAGVLPLSAEASSGPNAHPRINPKVRNLLQVYANLRRMLQCSCLRSPGPKKYLPKNSHRFSAMAQQLPKRCKSGHRGSSILLINKVRCRFKVLCPVRRPTNNLKSLFNQPIFWRSFQARLGILKVSQEEEPLRIAGESVQESGCPSCYHPTVSELEGIN